MSRLVDAMERHDKVVGHNRVELLLFQASGAQLFGINVFKVREVVRRPPLGLAPGAHPAVAGLVTHRGITVPVIDLGPALGLPPGEGATAPGYLIVTEINRAHQAFLASAVERIVNVEWTQVLPPPPGLGSGGGLAAVTEVEGALVEILDVEHVLDMVLGGGVRTEGGVGLRHTLPEGEGREGRDGRSRSAPGAAAHTAGPGPVRRVLIVDDSAVARRQMASVLEGLGLVWDVATNGREALELLEGLHDSGVRVGEHYALVLSDVEMPELDGYTLARRIKLSPVLRELYLVLHTSLSAVLDSEMVRAVGADAFLAKFQPEALRSIVQARIAALEGRAGPEAGGR